MVGEFLDRGSNGKIYEVTDLQNVNRPLVIKINSGNEEAFKQEVRVMKRVAEVFAYGKLPN